VTPFALPLCIFVLVSCAAASIAHDRRQLQAMRESSWRTAQHLDDLVLDLTLTAYHTATTEPYDHTKEEE